MERAEFSIGPLIPTSRKRPAAPVVVSLCAGALLAGLLTYDFQIALAAGFLLTLFIGSLVNRGKLFPYMVLILFITGNLLPMDKRFFPESSLSFNLDALLNVIVVVLSLIVLILNHRKLRRAEPPRSCCGRHSSAMPVYLFCWANTRATA